ncbi:MAG: ABC transporter permease [Bacteroidota bacterium]
MKASLFVILEMVRKEFFQIRRDKRMLAVSVVLPIVQVILLGYTATTDIKFTTMVVCDQDRTVQSRELIEGFTTSGYFVQKYTVDRVGDLGRYIEAGDAVVALVIPPGFAGDLFRGRTPQVQLILDGTDANTANVLLGYATRIVRAFSQPIVATFAARAGGKRLQAIAAEPRVWFNPELTSSNFMVPGVVAMVLMIITMTLTSLGIVKEKEIGTLEQLMVTPIKPHELILGKLIPFVIIGFVDAVIVLAVARFWFEVPIRGSLPLLFFLSFLFILTTLGLGLFVSTIAKSQQQAMLIAQFFFFMPFIFLSGFTFPISNMPDIIRAITYIIPLRYFLEILRSLLLKGAGLGELWFQAIMLFAIGVAVLWLSVLRFHKKLE